MKCEEVASDIKKNRLLPRLITKQVSMLYGYGLAVYKPAIVDGKLQKQWVDCPEIMDWLNSWEQRGLESGYKEVAKSIIKNYYYFRDCFVKWRFTKGKARGTMPLPALNPWRTDIAGWPPPRRMWRQMLSTTGISATLP